MSGCVIGFVVGSLLAIGMALMLYAVHEFGRMQAEQERKEREE